MIKRRTNSRRFRGVAIAGLLAISSSLIMAPSANAKAHINSLDSDVNYTTCEADVTVIGVRGSGQDLENTYEIKSASFFGRKLPIIFPTEIYEKTPGIRIDQYKEFEGTPIQSEGDQSDHIEGFSNEVATAAFELRKQFPDSLRFAWVTVEYEAAPIETAVLDRERYIKSFHEGADLVQDKIHEINKLCPSTQIAVIGFSQGSQAAHEGIANLTKTDREQIASVVLLADPSHEPRDTIPQNYYSSDSIEKDASSEKWGIFSERGIARQGVKNIVPVPQRFPEDMKDKVISVCAHGDKVCSTDSFMISNPASLVLAGLGFVKHGNVYQDRNNSDLYEVPAKWSAKLISKALLDMDESEEQNTIKEFSKTVLCPDLNFISAGGEYDDSVSGNPAEIAGSLGADIPATMLWEVVKNNPSKTIGFKGVRYTPSSSSYVENGVMDDEYKDALEFGISETNRTIDESLKECKDTKLILFGNEQGSHVMHEVIAKLDKNKLSKVSAVWLISDPLRNGNDPVVKESAGEEDTTMGTDASELSKKGGVLKSLGEDQGISMFPTELSGKVLSLCAISDGFCNAEDEEYQTYLGAYNMFSGLYEQPAKWIADVIK